MKCEVLSYEESLSHGATHKITVAYTDLLTAALTNTKAIYPFTGTAPIGTRVASARARVKTAFVGCATLTLQVGDGSDPNRNLDASDMKAAAGTWYFFSPSTTSPSGFNAADTVDALFTATTNNLDALTAGEVEIYLFMSLDTRLAA